MRYENEIKQNMWSVENRLSDYATKSREAIRLYNDIEDIRSPFFR